MADPRVGVTQDMQGSLLVVCRHLSHEYADTLQRFWCTGYRHHWPAMVVCLVKADFHYLNAAQQQQPHPSRQHSNHLQLAFLLSSNFLSNYRLAQYLHLVTKTLSEQP